jgi:CRP/FNR family transcriptional regulator
MRGPYGFDLVEDCQTCKHRGNGFFCQLPAAALKDFESIKASSAYPKGSVLFMEQQPARGVYMICEGEVKLSVGSSEGKTLILRIARAGEILGLMPTLSGGMHEVTAETIRPCQITFVRHDQFMRFLTQHPEAYERVVHQLNAQYQSACEQLRTLGLSASVSGKLAKLLLEWSSNGRQTKDGTRTAMPLTHEEIAELIGTTRETVTRTLGEFKSQRLVSLQGSTLLISNRAALENMVAA